MILALILIAAICLTIGIVIGGFVGYKLSVSLQETKEERHGIDCYKSKGGISKFDVFSFQDLEALGYDLETGKDSKRNLAFQFWLSPNFEQFILENNTIEELKQKLKIAEENQDFEYCAMLKDIINEKRNQA